MPMPHDIRAWLDDAWDEAAGHAPNSKRSAHRAVYNGMELKAIVNLDAAEKTDTLLVIRVRKPAE